MQRAGAHRGARAPAGSGGVDEDMANGDLGDGTRTKPRTEPVNQRSPSCSGLSSQGGSRRASKVGWSPEASWSYSQLHSISRPGCIDELSKEELRDRLQKATETIELLLTELEVAHRYLEGKYAALKILQGQAILEKATSHTKNLLQKSEERAKALEKEVNTLQWELSLSQLHMRTSEQAFEKNFYRYDFIQQRALSVKLNEDNLARRTLWLMVSKARFRMLSERNSLSEALKQTELEKEKLQAENLALSQHCVELLSRISPQSIYPVSKAPEGREDDHSGPQGPDPSPPPEDKARPL